MKCPKTFHILALRRKWFPSSKITIQTVRVGRSWSAPSSAWSYEIALSLGLGNWSRRSHHHCKKRLTSGFLSLNFTLLDHYHLVLYFSFQVLDLLFTEWVAEALTINHLLFVSRSLLQIFGSWPLSGVSFVFLFLVVKVISLCINDSEDVRVSHYAGEVPRCFILRRLFGLKPNNRFLQKQGSASLHSWHAFYLLTWSFLGFYSLLHLTLLQGYWAACLILLTFHCSERWFSLCPFSLLNNHTLCR